MKKKFDESDVYLMVMRFIIENIRIWLFSIIYVNRIFIWFFFCEFKFEETIVKIVWNSNLRNRDILYFILTIYKCREWIIIIHRQK